MWKNKFEGQKSTSYGWNHLNHKKFPRYLSYIIHHYNTYKRKGHTHLPSVESSHTSWSIGKGISMHPYSCLFCKEVNSDPQPYMKLKKERRLLTEKTNKVCADLITMQKLFNVEINILGPNSLSTI